MRFARFALPAFAALAISCHRIATARADVALLRVAIADWQEGPTDGSVCLDSHVLTLDASAHAPRQSWSPDVLKALLTDERIAVANSPDAPTWARRCTSRRFHPRIAIGVPMVRGDTAEVATAAFGVATATDSAHTLRERMILVRTRGKWVITAHPDMHFKLITP